MPLINSMQKHRRSADPRSVHDATRIITYACPVCGLSDSVYAGVTAPFCELDQRYMVEKSTVSGAAVTEIKNRVDDGTGTPTIEKNRSDKFKEGLVPRYLSGQVWPRSGKTKEVLQVAMNMDQGAFDRYIISLSWGTESTMTNVMELNHALIPFDSAPTFVTDPFTNTQRVLTKTVPKRTQTRIGSFTLTGGGNKERFTHRLVTLSSGAQSATFDMADLCNVVIRAL